MSYSLIGGFPSQQLSFSSKTKAWRKKCVDFGDNHSLLHYHLTRKSVKAMNINYDLLHGKLHLEELKLLVNPFNIDASFIPDDIQHYPIINSKIEVLKGEESKRLFDFRVVVTNPGAVSEIEEEKNKQVNKALQQLLMDTSLSEEDYQKELEKQAYYFSYEYQDKREARGNLVLNHYIKELEMNQMFNKGFDDVISVSEELYQCDIVGGEPYVEKLDPRDVRIISNGTSHRVEDADMVIIEQYWNKGRIIDTYWDQLSKKDIKTIESYGITGTSNGYDEMGNRDARLGFLPMEEWTNGSDVNPMELFNGEQKHSLVPYDSHGNIRVLRVYWKSRRQIKKVKSYDPITGEEQFDIYPENYIINTDLGEEEEILWINQAWEGTKIGEDIYVNMRPRPIQYNRLSNPSRCHFGIIGQIYGNSTDKPFSLVDIMKPYAYLYDVVHDRLNKTLARNHGKVVKLDFAKTPKGWDAPMWLHYMVTHGIAVEDSAKEGDGFLQGKAIGSLNNASSGVVDASLGNEIIQYTNLLEWISNKCGDLAGISRQREGQISNRETVGGVERATLQSSHSTEWLFFPHESVKKRTMECFLETAKIAFKGRKVKFDYILNDGSKQLVEFEGDEFAECDYGIVVDNSNGVHELNQKLDMLAQAGIQNQILDMSTTMKLYTTTSMAEKQRIVEACEKRMREQQEQQQQQQLQIQQQQIQMQQQIAQQQMEMQYKMHQEDNQTKILVAQINAEAERMRMAIMNGDNAEANNIEREKLSEQARQFDAKLKQDNAKLELEKKKQQDDARLKEKQINKTSVRKS